MGVQWSSWCSLLGVWWICTETFTECAFCCCRVSQCHQGAYSISFVQILFKVNFKGHGLSIVTVLVEWKLWLTVFLILIQGGENQLKKVNLHSPYHPYIRYFGYLLSLKLCRLVDNHHDEFIPVMKLHFLSIFSSKSLEILEAHFVDLVIENQEVLSCKEQWEGMLALVPDCILYQLHLTEVGSWAAVWWSCAMNCTTNLFPSWYTTSH